MDLRQIEEVIEELASGYQTGSDYWVHVTNVIAPSNFYVRSVNYDDSLKLIEYHIDQEAKVSIEPEMNDRVVYRAWRRGGKTMRGRVVGFKKTELSTTCQVFALDYGFIDEEVEFKDIFQCDSNAKKLPPLALRCQLEQCCASRNEWSEASVEAFKFFLGGETCKMVVTYNIRDKLTVRLYNSCPDDISTMLLLTSHASMGYVVPFASGIYSTPIAAGTQNMERTGVYYFNYKERQVKKTLGVRMLYYKNYEEFYVTEVEEYRKYRNLLKEVTDIISKQRVLREEELVIGRPVLVKDMSKKGTGYRGIIENVLPAGEARICLVDCGRRVLAEKTNIRSIPRSLLEHPVTAIYCRTEELGIGMTTTSFKQPGFKFNMTIMVAGSELKLPSTVKIP